MLATETRSQKFKLEGITAMRFPQILYRISVEKVISSKKLILTIINTFRKELNGTTLNTYLKLSSTNMLHLYLIKCLTY